MKSDPPVISIHGGAECIVLEYKCMYDESMKLQIPRPQELLPVASAIVWSKVGPVFLEAVLPLLSVQSN